MILWPDNLTVRDTGMKILVVEDDLLLRQGVQKALGNEQYSCDVATNGAEADALLRVSEYGLIILDLGLPDLDGLVLLKRWRQRGLSQPVLILTARDGTDNKVAGLDFGADDYMVKPFSLAELLARVRALLRRDHGKASNQLICGELQLDLETKCVLLAGKEVSLTRREFALLRSLAIQVGKVVSRERLQEDLYDWQDDIGSNTLEVHIHHLRRKLGSERIRTLRGEGYVLDVLNHTRHDHIDGNKGP